MLSLRLPLALSTSGLLTALLLSPAAPAQAPTPATPAAPHTITLDDLFRFHDVGGPVVSPDGQWVAYTVSTVETTADKRITDLWMVSWDGKEDIRLTWAGDVDEDSDDLGSSGAPRWSPDGKYLSFTAGRPGKAKGSQVWVLDRRGGEAHQLTDVKGHLSAYAWAPDAKKLLLSITPEDEAEAAAEKSKGAEKEKPKPIVLDRYHFKEDVEGYLKSNEHTQLWLWDVATHKLDKLTTDTKFDESNAVWSPRWHAHRLRQQSRCRPGPFHQYRCFCRGSKAELNPEAADHVQRSGRRPHRLESGQQVDRLHRRRCAEALAVQPGEAGDRRRGRQLRPPYSHHGPRPLRFLAPVFARWPID